MMPRLTYMLWSLLLASPVLGQTALQYTLNSGDVFTVRQEAVQQITQEMEGSVQEITNSIKGIVEFKVIGIKEEGYEIAVSFRELNLHMQSNLEGVLLDVIASDPRADDLQSRIFNSLLHVPIHLILDRRGDVLRVTGGDSLVARMAAASGVEDPFTLEVMKKSLERDFGSEALSNSYEQMTFIYPKSAIRIGDSWENSYQGKISARNRWTLDAISDGKARIHGNSSVQMNLEEATSSMHLTGDRITEVSTELATGFLIAMKVESNSEGLATWSQIADEAIPTTIKSTITYKRI